MAFAALENVSTPTLPGTELYSESVTGGTLYYASVKSPDGTALGAALTFAPATVAGTPQVALTALNATTGSLPQGAITGAGSVSMISSNATPGAQLVRTAAQMLADMPGGAVGMSWEIRITNTGAGTLTLTADSGATVTLTGTMTVPQNTTRTFVAKFNTATTATITAVGVGTYS